MKSDNDRALQVKETDFFYKVSAGISAAISVGSLLFFGGVGIFLLATGEGYIYSCIGIIAIILALAMFVGGFFEWKNSYLLVTEDAVWTRNFLKIEQCYPWENCFLIYKKKQGVTTDIYVHMRVRVHPKKRGIGTQKETKEVWTSLPWSFMSKEQKEQLLVAIENSKLAPEIKERFLESMSI